MAQQDASQWQNVPQRLWESAQSHQAHVALVGGRHARHQQLTYGELWREVDALAAGLRDLGTQEKQHIGLVSENADVWLLADLAILSIGAVDVPRGGDAPASEVQFCLGHAQCSAAFVETAEHAEKLGNLREHLQWVIVLRGPAPAGAHTLESVIDRGRQRLARQPNEVATLRQGIRADDLATIIYTSGTTGNPKGVMLTHGNLLHNVRALPAVVDFRAQQRFLSFLPSWHSFERAVEYVVLDQGLEIHYSSKWTMREDFRKVQPHFVCGVPRVWETFYNGLLGELEKRKGLSRLVVQGALRGSRTYCDAKRNLQGTRLNGTGQLARPPLLQRVKERARACLAWAPHRLADALIYKKLRLAVGGRVGAAVSGGGALPPHVDEFLVRAGVPLLNGYGLTESSPVISVRQQRRNVIGTIGRPVPMTEVRVVDEAGTDLGRCRRGVIQARGPQIMRGYFENSEATDRALRDGWLDTGDVGMLSSEGDLLITGRAKDTLVLRGGENVEPEPLESELCSSPYVADALVVGHGQKILGCLLVPDVATISRALGLPDSTPLEALAADPRVETLLRQEVANRISKNRGFRNYERVGPVVILGRAFSQDDGTLTATLKKRRRQIEEREAAAIQRLFPD